MSTIGVMATERNNDQTGGWVGGHALSVFMDKMISCQFSVILALNTQLLNTDSLPVNLY